MKKIIGRYMCAIFGILGEYNAVKAQRAISMMAHRGPDYCGIHDKAPLFMAHNRLSIVDVKARAHQPFLKGEVVVNFNGEIYNFEEIKKELNVTYETHSDTEVIAVAFEQWGERFVERLVGMFAIAIWDGESLYLYRDRIGEKPLFYLQQSESFLFASEIKALLPFLKQKRLHQEGLLSYLSFLGSVAPHTFYEGIVKLEAGHYLKINAAKEVIKKEYYSALPATFSKSSAEDAQQRFNTHMIQAVVSRLAPEVPNATLLSGGLDSSLIAALIKEERGAALPSYTVGYSGYERYDERRYARMTAAHIGSNLREVVLSKEQFIEGIDRVLHHFDEPVNDPAAIPLYYLFEQIRADGIKVVQSGEGSDELLLGYRKYFEIFDVEQAKGLRHRNWLKNHLKGHYSPNQEWEWYKRAFEGSVIFRSMGENFTDLQKNRLLKRNVKDNEAFAYIHRFREAYERTGLNDELLWYSYLDLNVYQSEHYLTKLDRMSMAHGVEGRTPFLDHRLIETVLQFSPSIRYGNGVPKGLLKELAKRYLPHEVIYRKKKGFSYPYMEWMLDAKLHHEVLALNKKSGFFREGELQWLLEQVPRGKFKHHFWGIFLFLRWWKKEFL